MNKVLCIILSIIFLCINIDTINADIVVKAEEIVIKDAGVCVGVQFYKDGIALQEGLSYACFPPERVASLTQQEKRQFVRSRMRHWAELKIAGMYRDIKGLPLLEFRAQKSREVFNDFKAEFDNITIEETITGALFDLDTNGDGVDDTRWILKEDGTKQVILLQ